MTSNDNLCNRYVTVTEGSSQLIFETHLTRRLVDVSPFKINDAQNWNDKLERLNVWSSSHSHKDHYCLGLTWHWLWHMGFYLRLWQVNYDAFDDNLCVWYILVPVSRNDYFLMISVMFSSISETLESPILLLWLKLVMIYFRCQALHGWATP